jgi:hypothetical protein
VLRYSQLKVWDANRREVSARFEVQGERISILVADAGAAYPLTIDPLITSQEAKLTAVDGAATDNFGFSVALAGDTALVGASNDDTAGGANAGSAYVFVRSGTAWSQQAKLTAADGAAYDYLGFFVALAGDTALVGAMGDDSAAGAAYVFVRNGTAWSQQAKLTASDGAPNDYFGYSVAIAGETALVGAYFDVTATGANTGSAYVFVRSGTAWSQQAKLTAADGAIADNFGKSVALAGDTALVGAPGDDTAGGADAGSAYVFVRSGTAWSQQAKLTAADGAASDQLGGSVALTSDTALVGAERADTAGGANAGSAYVFVRSGTAWSQQAKLTAADGAASDRFGNSVALAGDTALVGAYQDDTAGGADAGSAYVFVRNGTAWSQQAKLTAADGAPGDLFGQSVALSGDTALVGAYLDDTAAGTDAGSAYVFRLSSAPILSTLAATLVTATTATLNATINPNGLATTAQFEYGLTTSYGSTANIALSPNNGTSVQTVSAEVTGLTQNMTYHFRLTATNSGGPTSGIDQSFTTPLADTDGDGIPDNYETGTGIYVSPTNTGTSPTNSDTDGDGLTDWQEVNTSNTNPNIADTDSDGFGDGFEVSTGFNPNSATSTPETLSSIRQAAEYRFNAALGVSYRIEASTDVTNWATIETNIIGTGGVITRFYSIDGQPKRFFRSRRN